ncbi:MAG: hypothetical protein K2Q18_07005, partial [Bdellovibrionales bacterium]|nr:hypothetical protein [Bdellovibrionales bacterium]
MKISIVLLTILVSFLAFKRNDIIDTGQSLFFPKDTYEKIHDFSLFQLGSWNNIIAQNEKDALAICEKLRSSPLVLKAMCQPQLQDFTPLVNSWLEDQFLNYPAPNKAEFENLSSGELAKMSVLMGPEGQTLMEFLRRDPVNHKEALLEKLKTKMNDNFVWKEGLLRHRESSVILIPVQFNYKPEEIQKSLEIQKIIEPYKAHMLGVHQGHLTNQGTIVSDLNNVGIVGTIVTLLSLCFIAYFKLFKLAKLIIPNALGICVSIIATTLVFGKVHAITITFGTGIIGLAVDFGLHAIFLEDKKKVWHSNLYGFLTTLAVFVIFIFSDIPLIKQMMFFSTVALTAAYVFTFLLVGRDFLPAPKNFILKKNRWHLFSIIFAILGFYHLSSLNVDMSVKRFNYTTPEFEKVQNWFYSQMKNEKIFFKIYANKEWRMIENDFRETVKAGLRAESVYSFIEGRENQQQNLRSWMNFRDRELPQIKISEDKFKIFKPFFEKLTSLRGREFTNLEHPPEYIHHMTEGGKVLNLWFVKSKDEEQTLKTVVRDAQSLFEIFTGFTKKMTKEVVTFIPITFLVIFALLYFKYFSFKKSFICLIPFLFALGLYGLGFRYLHFPLSFMTLLGFFLIYGLSVDYGIFSTDLSPTHPIHPLAPMFRWIFLHKNLFLQQLFPFFWNWN